MWALMIYHNINISRNCQLDLIQLVRRRTPTYGNISFFVSVGVFDCLILHFLF